MIDHGMMVNQEFKKLIESLDKKESDPFLQSVYDCFKDQIFDMETCTRYQIYHDCGKPFSKEEKGRKYHDHEIHSYNQWIKLFPQDKDVAYLMLHDMDFHTGNTEEIMHTKYAPTLYFTAWAELYANCQMFGGQESTSFKIKKKKLIQQGKILMKTLTNK